MDSVLLPTAACSLPSKSATHGRALHLCPDAALLKRSWIAYAAVARPIWWLPSPEEATPLGQFSDDLHGLNTAYRASESLKTS